MKTKGNTKLFIKLTKYSIYLVSERFKIGLCDYVHPYALHLYVNR